LKQTPLLLTLAVLLLVAGGYIIYEKILNKDPLKSWDLVPAQTMFVYEKDICNTCIDEMQNSAVWDIIERASFFGKPVDSLGMKIISLIRDTKGVLVSAHITRKDDFDFVYYVPEPKNINPSSIFPALKGYKYSERELN
jgi:hypothetical protein